MITRRILLYSSYILYSISALCCGVVFYFIHHTVIDFSILAHYNPGRPSIVLDDKGVEWTRFELDKREPIELCNMPQQLINAFIAAEDWGFFNHCGISWKGICRSLLVNIRHGRALQGASTITQQLVKLLFLDLEKSFYRKIKEQIYALLVEQRFSKEQILQTYLNHVYFGCGIYGVQAASKRFWNKNVRDLSVDECAMLAGIVRSPSYYCPIVYPLSAEKRRNTILFKMKQLHFISHDEYARTSMAPTSIRCSLTPCSAPHAREYIRQMLEQMVGKKELYTGGLIVQTTLNSALQHQAETVFRCQIQKLRTSIRDDIDGGLISLEVSTGGIKALVGGYDFLASQFNRALQARRQIGSTFKPLLYAAAIASGKRFCDTEIDEPLTLEYHGKAWKPNNVNNTFMGEISLAYALLRSNNIVSIKTFLAVGADALIDLAKKSGLSSHLQPYPSLALGCVDATLQEVAAMFNVFAHEGMYVQPYMILWVKDKWGKKIVHNNSYEHRVMPPWISGQVTKILEHGMKRYQIMYGQDNRLLSDAIGKTGTTNDSRTCWFVGATPELTTAIYIGCDDNRSLGKNVYPLRTAFPIWLDLNKQVDVQQKSFLYDSSLRSIIIDEKTGALLTHEQDSRGMEIFI